MLTAKSGSSEAVLLKKNNSGIEQAIAPGSFVKEEYLLDIPSISNGQVTLTISNYAPIVILVEQASSEAPTATHPLPVSHLTNPSPGSELKEYFDEHLSFYEPNYFILGTYPAAEFQFSLKYKLLNFKDNWNPFTHFYFAYTQTSFWDVLSHDPSFYDTSYKPSVFFYYPAVLNKQFFQLDLQTGVEHESNGDGGLMERSLYTAYLQPKANFALPHNLQLSFQPRTWVYFGVSDNNADIADYRGYADLLTALTWVNPNCGEKIQFATKLRIGDEGSHVGLQFDFRFNLAGVPILQKFNPSIQIQYFTGYGQNLRQYNLASHAMRAGLCLWY